MWGEVNNEIFKNSLKDIWFRRCGEYAYDAFDCNVDVVDGELCRGVLLHGRFEWWDGM